MQCNQMRLFFRWRGKIITFLIVIIFFNLIKAIYLKLGRNDYIRFS